MLKREKYISQVRPFYESDLIKVITGIRRCGKSVVLEQMRDEILAQKKPVIHLNFERRDFYSKITNDGELVEFVQKQMKTKPKKKWYVFLDEIQTVKNWNLACKSLRLENLSLFIEIAWILW